MKTSFRLDKYLADMAVGTRTEVKNMIRKGLVTVNGEVIRRPEHKVDIEKDRLQCGGRDVVYQTCVYYMLNKPAGVITATNDKRQKTVLDLITDKERRDLFPVGRLDKDTEGLLLITNDGGLAHQLLSPKKHVSKLYKARVEGCVTDEDVRLFAEGLRMDEEWTALPAELKILSAGPESEVEVVIYEGKFHQIKRMFEVVGKKVVALKRLSMGTLQLDETLEPGAYRPLTAEELEALRGSADKRRAAVIQRGYERINVK